MGESGLRLSVPHLRPWVGDVDSLLPTQAMINENSFLEFDAYLSNGVLGEGVSTAGGG